MGSVFSRPKMPRVPALPPISDTPSNPSPDSGDSDTPPSGSGGGNAGQGSEVTPDEQRVYNILTRRRGRLGTINTSFGGVLNDPSAASPVRKTLLGE